MIKKSSENMMDYFISLTKHADPDVRIAAQACVDCYGSPKWKSRTMRKLLANLSWALYDHAIKKSKANAIKT